MKRHFKIIGLVSLETGFLANLAALFFRDRLSDFVLGFFEGIAIAALAVGMTYLIVCLCKKINPYDLRGDR